MKTKLLIAALLILGAGCAFQAKRLHDANALMREVLKTDADLLANQKALLEAAESVVDNCADRAILEHEIARAEGFYRAGTLPRRQHNPGSLVFSGQPGATPGAEGYARFKTDAEGWAALSRDLAAKFRDRRPLHSAWRYLR